MEANELRIGNLFQRQIRIDGELCWDLDKVESINRLGVNSWQDIGASGVLAFKDISGVPLTPKILLNYKFGIDSRQSHSFVKDRLRLVFRSGDQIEFSVETNHGYCYFDDLVVKYVHQLQNLYFALTGQELEICS